MTSRRTRSHPKISVTLDPEAAEAAKRLADAEGLSLSAWLSRASLREAKLAQARDISEELIAEYEAEHGPIPPEIDDQVRNDLARREAFLRSPATIRSYRRALESLDELVDEVPRHGGAAA